MRSIVRRHRGPVPGAQRGPHLPLEDLAHARRVGADSDVLAAAAVPLVGFGHQPQRGHVSDPAPHDASLLGREQQVQRVRVLGRVLRVVARKADDGHGREFTLHLGQPALVRGEPHRRAVDRLGEHLLVDGLAVGVERARADPLGCRELVLLDQGANPLPRGNASVGEQRLGERKAAFARPSRACSRGAAAPPAPTPPPAAPRRCGSATAP